MKLLNLLMENINSDVNKVWSSIKNDVHKRFNDGYATCPYATNEVVKALKDKYPITIVDGEYEGGAHWYPVLHDKTLNKKFIVDLGNNIKKRHIESGNIKPVIVPFPNSDYKTDKLLSVSEWNRFYPKIKKF